MSNHLIKAGINLYAVLKNLEDLITLNRTCQHLIKNSNEYFGFKPDLVAFCKAIGNGYPISALVGNKEILNAARFITQR